MTDREKSIIDCLDKPQYCGGITEVHKALKERGVEVKRLSDYLKRTNAVLSLED